MVKNIVTKPMLAAERARELLEYEPETGVLRWRVPRPNGVRAGDVAGSVAGSRGYREVRIDRRLYQSHRIVWLIVHGTWPSGGIDHINGVRTDNRLSNLREATTSENQRNQRRAQRNNKSGLLGVDRDRDKWRVQINVDGRRLFLGYYTDKLAAAACYAQAKLEFHGEFSASFDELMKPAFELELLEGP